MNDVKFKLPRLSTRLFFLVGAWCFLIQTLISIYFFFFNLETHTFLSALYVWMGILFSSTLSFFFFQSAHDLVPTPFNGSSVGVLPSSEEDIKKFIKEMRKVKE